jgi:hypothetical protein
LNLTTTLAHSSGQWIASQWPVCPLADIASPHRMGAALTYSRRYALFTLVGIAGEDDLDAPDLCTPAPAMNCSAGGAEAQWPPKTSGNGRMSRTGKTTRSAVLPAEQSATLRDLIVKEIAGLETEERASEWARAALARKNALTAADARLVETAFALKQSALSLSRDAEPSMPDLFARSAPAGMPAAADALALADAPLRADAPARADSAPAGGLPPRTRSTDRPERARIDKSMLTISTPKRRRDKEHLRFVAQQTCVLCGRRPSEAHHIRFAQPRALGRKSSDEFAVPLCRGHHRAVHRVGDEKAWWQQAGLDPLMIARKLWKLTRLGDRAEALEANKASQRSTRSLLDLVANSSTPDSPPQS